MPDPETRAALSAARIRALAAFPLSRVTEAFHDAMLGVLPPAHIQGVPGFFVTEAAVEDVHAQFVHRDGKFYGAYAALRDPATWITCERIAAFDAADPAPPVLAWYPRDREGGA